MPNMPTRIERRDLPTPDLFAINRPGLVVIVADPRVPQETIDRFLEYGQRSRSLHAIADAAALTQQPTSPPVHTSRAHLAYRVGALALTVLVAVVFAGPIDEMEDAVTGIYVNDDIPILDTMVLFALAYAVATACVPIIRRVWSARPRLWHSHS